MRTRINNITFTADTRSIDTGITDLTIEDIRLIVNETQKKVLCSSMQKSLVASIVNGVVTYVTSYTKVNPDGTTTTVVIPPLAQGDKITFEIDKGDDYPSAVGVLSEIASGKQAIAEAINAKGGSASATESFAELAEAVGTVRSFDLFFYLINNSDGSQADKIRPEWLRLLDLTKLPNNYVTSFYFVNVAGDYMEVVYPEINYYNILPSYTFRGAGDGGTLVIRNFKTYYSGNVILRYSLFKIVYLIGWTGQYTGGVNYTFADMTNLEELHIGSLLYFSPFNTFYHTTKLCLIEIGPGSTSIMDNLTLGLSSWNPTYWTSTEEGRALLNLNLATYFIPNLATVTSGEILKIGWYSHITADNRQAITDKGWTLTA